MFQELQKEAQSANPKDFLNLLNKHHITDYNEYLLFNLTNKENLFYQNLEFLSDTDIWSKEDISDKTLIAQTIDNDYLLADETSILVIPYSLNKNDSESFNMTIWDFLNQLEGKKLNSKILAVT